MYYKQNKFVINPPCIPNTTSMKKYFHLKFSDIDHGITNSDGIINKNLG